MMIGRQGYWVSSNTWIENAWKDVGRPRRGLGAKNSLHESPLLPKMAAVESRFRPIWPRNRSTRCKIQVQIRERVKYFFGTGQNHGRFNLPLGNSPIFFQ